MPPPDGLILLLGMRPSKSAVRVCTDSRFAGQKNLLVSRHSRSGAPAADFAPRKSCKKYVCQFAASAGCCATDIRVRLPSRLADGNCGKLRVRRRLAVPDMARACELCSGPGILQGGGVRSLRRVLLQLHEGQVQLARLGGRGLPAMQVMCKSAHPCGPLRAVRHEPLRRCACA